MTKKQAGTKGQAGTKEPGGKNTAAYAKAKLAELIGSGGRYGVPTRVLRPDDLNMPHKLQPGRLQVHGRTGRTYINGLTRREEEFLENSIDMLAPAGDTALRSNRVLRDSLKNAWVRVTGYGGAYSMSLPADTTPADRRGRDAYREKDISIITLSHGETSKEDWIGFLTGNDKSIDTAAMPGTAAHWATWVLEHEMAHTSGAGEAQADAMGSAHYIKTFGTDDIPRAVADIRAVNAILRHASEDYSSTYGWQPVAALDALLEAGVDKIKKMDDETIHDMRFKSHDDRRDAVDHFAGTLLRQQGGMLHTLGIKGLIHLSEKVLAEPRVDERDGAREVGQRFLKALRRLTASPGLHAVMRARKGIKPSARKNRPAV